MAKATAKNMEHKSEMDYGMDKKNLTSYIIGILLSLILTIIPYEVMHNKLYDSDNMAYLILLSCAVLQLIVQVICFLRLNFKTEASKTNVYSFVFSIVIVLVVVVASMWIMFHLNYNMVH